MRRLWPEKLKVNLSVGAAHATAGPFYEQRRAPPNRSPQPPDEPARSECLVPLLHQRVMARDHTAWTSGKLLDLREPFHHVLSIDDDGKEQTLLEILIVMSGIRSETQRPVFRHHTHRL